MVGVQAQERLEGAELDPAQVEVAGQMPPEEAADVVAHVRQADASLGRRHGGGKARLGQSERVSPVKWMVLRCSDQGPDAPGRR